MNQQRAFAWGQCLNLSTKSKLADSLRLQGFNVNDRSHSIVLRDCENFTIEFDSQSEAEASIEGTAATLGALMGEVNMVAAVLQAADVKFWIEVTDSFQNPVRYFHHQCPER